MTLYEAEHIMFLIKEYRRFQRDYNNKLCDYVYLENARTALFDELNKWDNKEKENEESKV